MSGEHERTVLLAEHADRAALESAAARHGWPRAAISTAGFAEMEQVAWQTAGLFVLYSEVHLLGHRVVRVTGESEAVVEEALGAVLEAVPTVEVDELLGVLLAMPPAESAPMIRALNGLRAADIWNCANGRRPPEDPRYTEAVERAVRHPERQVVRALVDAVGDLMAVRPGLEVPIVALRDADGPARDVIEDFAAFCDAAR
ncbi:hypothetical protein [Actinomadura sp. 6K520]|uniref:hypothetical protein n=1 Tax=Actinomadura sp. 6K520 TaxID=2530364 RepID=UPI00104B8B1E|nr:hypothetical protein [Actinomadura sp. 6K520]TDE32174.1 hypothetical protein E1289_16385 [Actinomadura sp. 6K520]